MSNSVPTPARLVLLDQLASQRAGAKVRFLGCVNGYDAKTATVTLKDRYPAIEHGAATALVSIGNVLETSKHTELEVGAWINIVGYVSEQTSATANTKPLRKNDPSRQSTRVDAVMLWSAGAIKKASYDNSVRQYQGAL